MQLKMLFLALVLTSVIAGCSTQEPYQISPDFSNRSGELKRIGIVFDVHIYTQNGEDTNRSAQSLKNFEETSVQELDGKGYSVTVLPPDDDLRALSTQYQRTRGNMARPFSDNKGEVNGLEPLSAMTSVMTKENVDSIVIVDGVDYLPSSSGVVGGLALSALTGVYWGADIRAFSDFAMLDKSGKIVFYDRRVGEKYNLTDGDSISTILSEFANDLAVAQQPVSAK